MKNSYSRLYWQHNNRSDAKQMSIPYLRFRERQRVLYLRNVIMTWVTNRASLSLSKVILNGCKYAHSLQTVKTGLTWVGLQYTRHQHRVTSLNRFLKSSHGLRPAHSPPTCARHTYALLPPHPLLKLDPLSLRREQIFASLQLTGCHRAELFHDTDPTWCTTVTVLL